MPKTDKPFDTDVVPFPHENTPGEQHTIEEPKDGQLAFDFFLAPPDTGHGIESPDLTDDKLFDNLPKTYSEHVAALKKEGAIVGDIDEERGAILEAPENIAIVNETTDEPLITSAEAIQQEEAKAADADADDKKETAPKRRTRADVAAEAEKVEKTEK